MKSFLDEVMKLWTESVSSIDEVLFIIRHNTRTVSVGYPDRDCLVL